MTLLEALKRENVCFCVFSSFYQVNQLHFCGIKTVGFRTNKILRRNYYLQ